MSSIAIPTGPPAPAVALLDRVRGEWRRAVLLRASLRAFAMMLGIAATLVVADQLLSLPAPLRALLRPLVPAAGIVIIARAARTAWPGPSAARLALLVEERGGTADHTLSAALSITGDGPVVRAFLVRAAHHLSSVPGRVVPLRVRRDAIALTGAVLAAALVMALVPGGFAEIGARWFRLVADPATGIGPAPAAALGRTADEAALELRDVRVFIRPPAYTGEEEREAGGDVIAALAGSTLRIEGHAPAQAGVLARILGGDEASVSVERDAFVVEHTLTAGDRGIEIVARADDAVIARRVLPLDVRADAAPVVELREPAEDVVVATPSGVITIVAAATDDFGIAEFRLAWILSRGSGESFSFTDGGAPWSGTRTVEGARVGTYALDLGALALEPGDVLHLRAVALDGNTVTGPGEGVSATRLIRVARAGEEAEATTLVGFPIELEKDPILSQRMIVLLTERLIERAPALDAAALRVEAEEIARQQARLRERLADIIYARTSGEEEEGAHAGEAMDKPALPPVDSLTPAQREERLRALLEAASAATGQGTLEEQSHDHDPDPALMVNLPLVPAFNAMYEAERWLRQADPRAALPHELRALEIIQRVREAERVYLRGAQTVAPVDVAGVRGTGKLEDADPAARSASAGPASAGAHVAALADAAARLDALDTRGVALLLSDLSARLLEDAAVDRRAGELLARAAGAARSGDAAAARELTAAARQVLSPPSGSAPASTVEAPRSAAGARYVARTPIDSGTTAVRPSGADPFTFATARYASGDWDSAQLVPANLIHSLALYTDVPVEPEGVVVDLDSPELFRHPFVYITGHLPVRFTVAESNNLRAYVERGGFVFVDDHNHDIDGAFHRTVTAEIERIFGEGALERVPRGDELYHTFFTFEDGPPATSHELNGWGDGLIHEHLFAVRRPDGRIGLLYSNKDYSSEWSYHVQNKRFLSLDNTRFGVNVLLYALTR